MSNASTSSTSSSLLVKSNVPSSLCRLVTVPFPSIEVCPELADRLRMSSTSPLSDPSKSTRRLRPPPVTVMFSNRISPTDAIVKPPPLLPGAPAAGTGVEAPAPRGTAD